MGSIFDGIKSIKSPQRSQGTLLEQAIRKGGTGRPAQLRQGGGIDRVPGAGRDLTGVLPDVLENAAAAAIPAIGLPIKAGKATGLSKLVIDAIRKGKELPMTKALDKRVEPFTGRMIARHFRDSKAGKVLPERQNQFNMFESALNLAKDSKDFKSAKLGFVKDGLEGVGVKVSDNRLIEFLKKSNAILDGKVKPTPEDEKLIAGLMHLNFIGKKGSKVQSESIKKLAAARDYQRFKRQQAAGKLFNPLDEQ